MYTLDNEHKAFEMLTWGRKLSTIVTIVSFLGFHVSFWVCCILLDIFTCAHPTTQDSAMQRAALAIVSGRSGCRLILTSSPELHLTYAAERIGFKWAFWHFATEVCGFMSTVGQDACTKYAIV